MKLHLKYRLYTNFYTICLLLIFLDYWIFNRLPSFWPSYRLTGYWLPSLFNFFWKWKQLKKRKKKLICILKNVHSYTCVYILLNLINSQSYWKKNEVCVFETAWLAGLGLYLILGLYIDQVSNLAFGASCLKTRF